MKTLIEFWNTCLTKKGKVAAVFGVLIVLAVIAVMLSGGINAPAGFGNG